MILERRRLPPYPSGGPFSSDKGPSSWGFHLNLGFHTTPGYWGRRAGLVLSHRQASPVDDVEGVQVANGAGHLGSVEAGPGLQESALPLQVEEELEGGGM